MSLVLGCPLVFQNGPVLRISGALGVIPSIEAESQIKRNFLYTIDINVLACVYIESASLFLISIKFDFQRRVCQKYIIFYFRLHVLDFATF